MVSDGPEKRSDSVCLKMKTVTLPKVNDYLPVGTA